jgi:hypothetical protein
LSFLAELLAGVDFENQPLAGALLVERWQGGAFQTQPFWISNLSGPKWPALLVEQLAGRGGCTVRKPCTSGYMVAT